MTEQQVLKIDAEIANLMAETAKLNAETSKLNKEARYYLVIVGAAIFAAAATFAKLFL